MIECSINNLEKHFGGIKIFENISFQLKSRERIGLIGRNGCGKTTLMKILIGQEEYTSGTISFRKGVKLGYLDQIFKVDRGERVIDVLKYSFRDALEIKNEMEKLEASMKTLEDRAAEPLMKEYSRLLFEYELKGGYNIEVDIAKVCEGLNIDDNFKNREFEKLSGGEKTRVMLGKLLLEKPDILLMDEPTNHLDIKSIEWLEEFLKEYEGAVLIISHDRVFLDKVVEKIFELKEDHMEEYLGNYSYYIVEKEKRFEEEYKRYLNQKRKIDQMERQIERYRIWGAMRDSEKMYVRAKEIEKRLDRVDRIDRPDEDKRRINLGLDGVARSGKIVLSLEGVAKNFRDKKLFDDINIKLYYKDRACIMGDNGSGKSTLLNIILGNLREDKGRVKIGESIKYGYLPQNIVFEDEDISVLEYFQARYNLTIGEARTELAKVLFVQDDVFKDIKFLSGGEKTRLKLISLIYEKVNFMILDEPTNHLDIDSREVLEDLLVNYGGTILFVSHDRYFIEKIAGKMFILKDRKLEEYHMPYMEYREKFASQEQEKEPEKLPEKKLDKRPVRKKDRRQKLERLEEDIVGLENKLEKIEEDMVEYGSDLDRLSKLYEEKENLEGKLETTMQEWSDIVDEYID